MAGGFKLHFPLIETIFTAIGAAIIGGPVGIGIVIGTAIATQDVGNLKDMYHDEYGNKVNE
jgi:ABC-type phosphate transport system permease subunit